MAERAPQELPDRRVLKGKHVSFPNLNPMIDQRERSPKPSRRKPNDAKPMMNAVDYNQVNQNSNRFAGMKQLGLHSNLSHSNAGRLAQSTPILPPLMPSPINQVVTNNYDKHSWKQRRLYDPQIKQLREKMQRRQVILQQPDVNELQIFGLRELKYQKKPRSIFIKTP